MSALPAEKASPDERRMTTRRRLLLLAAALGPGLMVMLADTDAGSIVTAAQSGAQWGYRLILPQILLIPILYVIQEATVRLGIFTRKGQAQLIREHFGAGWALLSVATLFVSVAGALITEYAGLAAVGGLFGVPAWLTVPAAAVALVATGLAGSYGRVEKVGVALGLFELLFIPAALLAHPDLHAVGAGLYAMPLGEPGYLFMLAANVGAVIMPWMIYYQQGAVVDKGLQRSQLKQARWDTLLGSVLTQVVVIFVIIATAATVGRAGHGQSLTDVQSIAHALDPVLGATAARFTFGLGMVGAAFVAALVVSLAASWAVGEVVGFRHSLNDRVPEGKWFYALFSALNVGGALLVLSGVSLLRLTIDIEVMNALLLPIVLGFLLVLETRALPAALRLRGLHRLVLIGLCALVMAFGVGMAALILSGRA